MRILSLVPTKPSPLLYRHFPGLLKVAMKLFPPTVPTNFIATFQKWRWKIAHLIQRDSGNLGGRVPSPLLVDFGRFWSILKHKSGGRISSPSFVPTKQGDEILSPLLWNLKEIDGNVEFLTKDLVSGHSHQLSFGQNLMKIAGNVEFFGGEVATINFLLVEQLFITCSNMKKWRKKAQ